MLYPFSALLARMKYITRWSLMHSTRPESLSEHTCDTALLAHLLCLIAKHYTGTPCRPVYLRTYFTIKENLYYDTTNTIDLFITDDGFNGCIFISSDSSIRYDRWHLQFHGTRYLYRRSCDNSCTG